MYILYHMPRHGAAVLLAGMRSILKSETSLRSLASEIPKDPRKLLTIYDFDPVTFSYVCCPSCYALYPHVLLATKKRKAPASPSGPNNYDSVVVSDEIIGDTHQGAPTYCTHCRVCKGMVCGNALFDTAVVNSKSYVVPQCKYKVQDLKQWVGWLLSWSAVKEQIYNAFQRLRKEYMEDMWDAGHLSKILLTKGEWFLPGPADEMRLAFSFLMDSFNPYHMKEAKQMVLSTAIWLILLNLPPHLRYCPKNMFLTGIIPGPKKPSLSDINHSLELLVDALLEFFEPSVWYSRMARHSQGCRVHTILVPIVSDMLAAWQAGGFASPMATNFCTCCNLRIQDIENLDQKTWPERDAVEHIRLVRCWWDAETLEEQDTHFRNYGIRWSPLLNLPYWNPILFMAIEPMHVFDAGLFQTHCRQVWGINVSVLGGDGTATTVTVPVPRPPNSDFEK